MAGSAIAAVQDLLNNDKKKDGSDSIEPKDFFWDQFLKYISSAILALTVLNVSVDLLRDGGVICFPPPDTEDLLTNKLIYEFGRDQASYLNNYCARSVPITEYFPLYILVHGIFLIAPHYIWHAVNKGDFDSFFAIAEKFDRLRDYKTGEYPEQNFDRVSKLEFEYGGKRRKIFRFYIFKLFVQLCVCIGSIIFSGLYFTDFSFSFDCPKDFAQESVRIGWPLNATVPCVYTSLRILSLIRYADFILVGLAGALTLYGLAWCLFRHIGELGHIEIARFQFQSGLTAHDFVFPSVISWPSHRLFIKKNDCKCLLFLRPLIWVLTHYPRLRNIVSPRIKNDFDFLVMRLFRADLSHGKVFRDIQVGKELKRLSGRDHQLLHLYIDIQNSMRDRGWLPLTKKPKQGQKAETERKKTKKATGCCGCLRRIFSRRSRQRETVKQDTTTETQTTTRGFTNPLLPEEESPNSENGAQETTATGSETQSGSQREAETVVLETETELGSESESEAESEDDVEWIEQAENDLQEGASKDFHRYFLESSFNCNPETNAFNYFKAHLGNVHFQEEDFSGIRDVFYWFFQFLPKYHGYPDVPDYTIPRNDLALDISFGTHGFALVLARAFTLVMSVNFHPFYRDCDKVAVCEAFYTNYVAFTFPENIYTQADKKITIANDLVFNCLRQGQAVDRVFDFILVGPIMEEPKIVSVNLLIENLCTVDQDGYIGEDALLIAVRPLKVGSKKLTKHYQKFKPSEQLFENITKSKVLPALRKAKGVQRRRVDNIRGIEVKCGSIPCVFRFDVYRYKMKPQPTSPEDKNQADNGPQEEQPNNDATDGGVSSNNTQQETEQRPNNRQPSTDSGVFSPTLPGPNNTQFTDGGDTQDRNTFDTTSQDSRSNHSEDNFVDARDQMGAFVQERQQEGAHGLLEVEVHDNGEPSNEPQLPSNDHKSCKESDVNSESSC